MRVAILTAMNKRHHISKIYCNGIRKFMESAPCDVSLFAVITEKESEQICVDNRINFTYAANRPLGAKWNHGLKYALDYPWDYLMIMGDDDIISPEAWSHYYPLMVRHEDYFGFTKIYFYEMATGKTYIHDIRKKGNPKNHLIGCGRMVSRKAIERLPRDLWKPDANMAMDFYSERNLMLNLKIKPVQIDECLMVDLKSGENIWDMNSYRARSTEVDSSVLDFIMERNAIFSI